MFLGVIFCLFASVIFATLCYYTAYLTPLNSYGVFGWRILGTVILLSLLVTLLRDWQHLHLKLIVLIEKPFNIIVLCICTCLISFQIFAFAWAPLHQSSEALAMGYFLLPLMMVLCGRLIFNDKLSRLQTLAIIFAAIGVSIKLIIYGNLSWISLLVMIGYPPYFILKRKLQLNAIHSMLLEHLVMAPFAIGFLHWNHWTPDFFHAHQQYGWVILIGLGILGGSGLLCYIAGSRLLPLSLFGMLGYVEPLLLFVVSLILPGSTFSPIDFFIYIPVWMAIVCLIINGWRHYRYAEKVVKVI